MGLWITITYIISNNHTREVLNVERCFIFLIMNMIFFTKLAIYCKSVG